MMFYSRFFLGRELVAETSQLPGFLHMFSVFLFVGLHL